MKKMLSIALAGMLSICILGGCSSSDSSKDTKNTTSEKTSSTEAVTNKKINVDEIETPADLLTDAAAVQTIAGDYKGMTEDAVVNLTMYDTADDDYVGEAYVFSDTDHHYRGKLLEISTNVYLLDANSEDTILLSFHTGMNNGVNHTYCHLYINGSHANDFTLE
jgi:PBP1b-binding outer membrane lipoprotein LpoB